VMLVVVVVTVHVPVGVEFGLAYVVMSDTVVVVEHKVVVAVVCRFVVVDYNLDFRKYFVVVHARLELSMVVVVNSQCKKYLD
jgi:hypothetical protein